MKTKVKLIFALSLIATLFIGFMIGISVDYPNPKKSDLAGTFGKAEKFRKVQMTEKDIQLRSDMVKDTAKLRSMIQGLIYFSLFTEELRTNLDLCTISFSAQGMGTQPGESNKINVMKDYSDFIRNNNSSLNATIVMLSTFYGKEGGDASQDVERTLQDFGNYVNNMNKKDSILSQVLVNMDDYLLNSKTLQSRKAEFSQLKSIRDQLLVKGIQLGGLLGNKGVVVSRIKYAMDSQLKMGSLVNGTVDAKGAVVMAQNLRNNLDAGFTAQSKLDVQIGSFINAQIASKLESNVSAIVYDKASLQFGVVDMQAFNALQQSLGSSSPMGSKLDGASLINSKSDAMGNIMNATNLAANNLQVLGILRAGGDLKIFFAQPSLGQMMQSQLMSGLSMDASLKLCQMGAMSTMNANGSYGIWIPMNAVQAFAASSLEAR
ncbi:MAG TPA: hypothetical protein VIK10_08800 [Prolixibacteraceae bacterium]